MCGHCFTVCYVQYVLLSVVIQPSRLPNPVKVIIIIIIIIINKIMLTSLRSMMKINCKEFRITIGNFWQNILKQTLKIVAKY